MNRESNREARLCRRRLLYSQRMAAETPEQREARLARRRLRDGARRAAARAAQSLDMFCLACTLFRNMKLKAIAQSGSPPNVLHSPSSDSIQPLQEEEERP